ncbi:4-oxalocrotonate tautomerase [Paraburkholderia sp. SEWSISQ10-3 4]|uniref:4-oxalocrotonate tautomerase n=1 Tax=Paraburkholderia TaxID=1822464 RepID=UPI000B81721F|nr:MULTISPECIES: 4-oxalocrotonate tautomerase [Paraburkholderia]MBK3843146.1 4-oxalocrotonate tautomerase [Paraburkholderia aspalathi]MCX4140290.1 4-oxalocrotonate tautomerase [Paraburkholderia aspalathi]MDN7172977.1 4-oxalocrotonate tautomerase [Paraburkholderia sp. SEWSISQ10-3 4]MDQ6502616.1 4-oxalocrotonate tautomerase [Paraburkholderia aspalathi]
MPTLHVQLLEGRSAEQKRKFIDAVTKATCESLCVEPGTVDVVLSEIRPENWAKGGQLLSGAI